MLQTARWLGGRPRRCGICLFKLDHKAKPLALDIGSDWIQVFYTTDSHQFRFENLAKSARRGCAACLAIAAHLRQHSNVSLLTTGSWNPRDMLPCLELENPSGRLEICIPRERFPEDPKAIHPCIVAGTKVAGNTGDDMVLSQAAAWLRRCRNEHEECRSPVEGFMPTRLLFIGEQPSATVRLIEHLATPQSYAALSHRWSPETLEVSLNQSNLQERRENGISLSRFPPMMRDVMRVLRYLGIYYVWIDCMCIIQGDAADWGFEAARMASIYANAALTIAASWCHGSAQRLFSDRDEQNTETSIPVEGTPPLFIRNRVPHLPSQNTEYSPEFYGPDERSEWPLMGRGWVYQERILSRRMLHFSRQEIAWECNETTACECGRYDFDGPTQTGGKAALTSQSWRDIIQGYSSREFTFPSDRLPALSGIAKAFEESFQWTYVAGMWVEDLRDSFCWCREGPAIARPDNSAPSWSWASTSGRVTFWGLDARGIDFQDCPVVYHGDRYMGGIENAELTVVGSVFPATLRHGIDWTDTVESSSLKLSEKTNLLTWSKGGQFGYGIQVRERIITFVPDYKLDDSVLSGTQVLCLPFGCTSFSETDPDHPENDRQAVFACCLVVICVNEQKCLYERIGYFEGWDWDNALDQPWAESISETKQLILV